jgi:diguanylate cyclase (GGDEF)-like protein
MAALRNGGDHARRASAESGGAGRDFDMRLMARTLGGLFVAGSTLVALTLALPQSPRANVAGLLAIVGLAYLVGGLLLWRASAVPRRLLPLAPAFGSTLVTGFAYFSAQDPSPMIFFYLWVFLYSAYFFTARETMAQVAYVGVAYGALLIARDPPGGIAEWWIIGMGTPLVAAILIRYMREQGVLLIARLHEAARIDPLTKLSNRQAFRELLDLEIERARRGETPMTIVVGDLDNFKEVNDRSGRHVGDAALQRLARLFEGGTRQIDGLARVGGEEFALILPDTDAHAAFIIAERLRCSVRAEFAADAVPVTISFGAASHPKHGETAGSLLRAADQALHVAKESGRDSTVLHSPSLRNTLHGSGDLRDIAGERFVAVVLDLAEDAMRR